MRSRSRVLTLGRSLADGSHAEGYEDDSETAIHAAWADEVQHRSRELASGSVRGLSVEEAHRVVASDPRTTIVEVAT
jgi:putative addiction module component